MMPVRFTRGQAPYNAGEVAGFPQAEAERMIAVGVAVPYAPASAAPSAPAKTLDTPPVDKMARPASTKPASSARKK
jgi:hypothetical protein